MSIFCLTRNCILIRNYIFNVNQYTHISGLTGKVQNADITFSALQHRDITYFYSTTLVLSTFCHLIRSCSDDGFYKPKHVVDNRQWVSSNSHFVYLGRRETYTGFSRGNLKERDSVGDLGADGRIILRWIFRKWDVRVWTGSSWLLIGKGGGHLWLR